MANGTLDQYRTASEWTLSKVAGASDQLDADTPCDGWDDESPQQQLLAFTGRDPAA